MKYLYELKKRPSVKGFIDREVDKLLSDQERWEQNHSVKHLMKAIAKKIRIKSRHLEISQLDVLKKYLEDDLSQKYLAETATYKELITIIERLK